MKALTVKELSKWCDTAIKVGYGDKVILVNDDDECNGYHALYNGLCCVGNTFKRDYMPNLSGMSVEETNDAILLR